MTTTDVCPTGQDAGQLPDATRDETRTRRGTDAGQDAGRTPEKTRASRRTRPDPTRPDPLIRELVLQASVSTTGRNAVHFQTQASNPVTRARCDANELDDEDTEERNR